MCARHSLAFFCSAGYRGTKALCCEPPSGRGEIKGGAGACNICFDGASSKNPSAACSFHRSRSPVSLRLGHARALTRPRRVIHSPRAASLPPGGRQIAVTFETSNLHINVLTQKHLPYGGRCAEIVLFCKRYFANFDATRILHLNCSSHRSIRRRSTLTLTLAYRFFESRFLQKRYSRICGCRSHFQK